VISAVLIHTFTLFFQVQGYGMYDYPYEAMEKEGDTTSSIFTM
jgi:hypothetical protein